MFKFLKKLFGSKQEAGNWAPPAEDNTGVLAPQHNVNPKPKGKKPAAPKAPPKPRTKKVEVKVEPEAPKKRGRKPKAK